MSSILQPFSMTDFKSLSDIAATFPDEESCMRHLEELRWQGFVVSPFDPISTVYICKGGRYRCRNTGKYFNAKTGTIFYNSKIELQKWFMAIWILGNTDKPITSIQLGKDLDITQKSAWYMIQRIKTYLGIEPDPEEIKKMKIAQFKSRRTQQPKEIEVVVEKDKMQMLEWLQLLKK